MVLYGGLGLFLTRSSVKADPEMDFTDNVKKRNGIYLLFLNSMHPTYKIVSSGKEILVSS